MSPDAKDPIDKVRRAIGFALERHEGQYRKGSRTPYASHPMRIFARLAIELGVKDEDLLCAAILHDTIEDTKTDFDDLAERFGENVASWVATLTHDKRLPEKERDHDFTASLAAAPWQVRLVKLGDMLDNVLDSHELPEAKRASYLERKREELGPLLPGLPDVARPLVEKLTARLGVQSPPAHPERAAQSAASRRTVTRKRAPRRS